MNLYDSIQVQTAKVLTGTHSQTVEDGFQKEGTGFFDKVGDVTSGLENVISDHPAPALLIGGVTGLLIGTGAEYISNKKVLKHREALSSIHADLIDNETITRRRRLGKSLISIAAVGGLGFGIANTALWINPDSEQDIQPNIEVIIDKSGATLTQNDQESAVAVRSIVNQIDASLENFAITGIVASSGSVRPMDLQDAAAVDPFGHAPIADAFQQSIDNITRQLGDFDSDGTIEHDAIVVVTDGNTVNGTLTPQQIEGAEAPVFVLDVSDDGSGEASLRAITELTDGQYYDRDELDTVEERKDVINSIGSTLESAEENVEQGSNWLIKLAVAGATSLALAKWAIDRPKLTSNIVRRKRKTTSDVTKENN